MRTIGTLPDEREARRFEDYLLTLDIKSMVEAEDNEWIVWIFDEDHLDTAREELARYRENPEAKQYQAVAGVAGKIRKEALKQEEAVRKQMVNVRDRWRQPAAARAPFTMFLILASIGVAILSSMGNKVEPVISTLGFARFVAMPGSTGWGLPRDARGDEQIRNGELWRAVTPIFIHMTILHLVFNMYWTFQFGRLIESRRGTLRIALMVLLIAVVSNLLQYAMTKRPGFGGMSGVNYGLFGYLWMKTYYDPDAGMALPQSTIVILLIFFALCWTNVGIFRNIANWAHAGGLIVGVILGYFPVAVRELKRK